MVPVIEGRDAQEGAWKTVGTRASRMQGGTQPLPQPKPPSYLPNSIGEDVDYLLVRGGYDALSVDFNDPMSHADASPLSYSPSHEAADLPEPNTRLLLEGSIMSPICMGLEDSLPWDPHSPACTSLRGGHS